jgi:hypothetical protein
MLGRREVDGELNWVDGGRRRRRRAAEGGGARWCKSGDLASAMRSTATKASGTYGSLTLRRNSGDGGAVDGAAHGGGAARVRQQRGASSARISRRKGRDGGYGGGLIGPGQAC